MQNADHFVLGAFFDSLAQLAAHTDYFYVIPH